jgi:hypothetical protein
MIEQTPKSVQIGQKWPKNNLLTLSNIKFDSKTLLTPKL